MKLREYMLKVVSDAREAGRVVVSYSPEGIGKKPPAPGKAKWLAHVKELGR